MCRPGYVAVSTSTDFETLGIVDINPYNRFNSSIGATAVLTFALGALTPSSATELLVDPFCVFVCFRSLNIEQHLSGLSVESPRVVSYIILTLVLFF